MLKKTSTKIEYDKENQKPILKCSICTGEQVICTNLIKILAFVTCPFFVFQQKNPQNTQERHPQKEG